MKILRLAIVLVAIVFGIATIIAGAGVLTGADPGYVVFRPLLIFNTIMGVVYTAVGLTAWKSVFYGRITSGIVFVFNLLVLCFVGYLYATGGEVAIDSVRAMILRTFVWLGLFLGLVWLDGKD